MEKNRPSAKVERNGDEIPNPEYFILANDQENMGLTNLSTIFYNLAYEEKEGANTDFPKHL